MTPAWSDALSAALIGAVFSLTVYFGAVAIYRRWNR
jgi:hypothetical protein